MKKRILTGLLALTLCLALAGCGGAASSGGAAPSAPSALPSATPLPTPSPTPGPTLDPSAVDSGPLTDLLNNCVSFGEGEMGVSLKTTIAAAACLDWAQVYQKATAPADLTRAVSEWYNAQSEERRQLMVANWPSIRTQAEQILENPENLRDLLETAGVTTDYSNYDADFAAFAAAVEEGFGSGA